jgi:hypothetical protein
LALKTKKMQSKAEKPEQYLAELPSDRKEIITKIRQLILDNLPHGFTETMTYGMLSYGVPHSVFPAGYHCDPKQPLPFISLASQKNYISFYHLGLYDSGKLYTWFTEAYKKTNYKLDMGKCCVRFKKETQIPFDLLAELCKKMTLTEYIDYYKTAIDNRTKK